MHNFHIYGKNFIVDDKLLYTYTTYSIWFQLPVVKKACPFVKIVFNTRLPRHSNVSYYQLYTGCHFENYADEFMFSPETCWLKTPIPLTSVHNQDKLYLTLKEHFYDISQKQIELKPTSMYSLALLTYFQHKHLVDYLLVYDDWMKDVQIFKILPSICHDSS